MDKYNGKYYLQYACPGAEYNVYADGVYVSGSPLGPFTLAENNPYSYHAGGFMPGAGHGSTMWDLSGNLWHTSTMRISVNHQLSAASVSGEPVLMRTENFSAISVTGTGRLLFRKRKQMPGKIHSGIC